MTLTEIIINNENFYGKELIFRFGERSQAVCFHTNMEKMEIVRTLQDFADNISHDIMIENTLISESKGNKDTSLCIEHNGFGTTKECIICNE